MEAGNISPRLAIAFYGDDFTGSTDALEFLCRAGIKTVLFIEAPSPDKLENYQHIQAIGVAGMSRTLSPEAMEETLFPAFKALEKLNPRHVHYKVCSTFDSSAKIGSIGKAIDIGAAVFNSLWVPLLVAAPLLGRYSLFGNLFARMGIGSEGSIYRLDRHPSMSKHPVTPADESDLRLHLSKQTDKRIGLFDILQLHAYQDNRINPDFSNQDIVLFDALVQTDLQAIGQIIDAQASANQTVFSAGSSGIEMALGAHWQAGEALQAVPKWEPAPSQGPVLVASGSCSAVSAAQIKYALQNGFSEIPVDTLALAEQFSSLEMAINLPFMEAAAEVYAQQAAALIKSGKNVLVHTSLGSEDVRVAQTDRLFKQKGFDKSASAIFYGTLMGQIAKRVAEKTTIQRIVIVGGDTSSYAARAMGIEAVEMLAPLSPGAPICLAHALGSAINQLQVVFKGGQVGKEDFFITAAQDINEPKLNTKL